tara:strand:+ start:869 stop:1414 length:546 start_codon:yes stop_codon:yes gene_type:complete
MKISLLTFTILCLFIGCSGPSGGGFSGSTESRYSNDQPEWSVNVPTDPNFYYGVGQAKKQNPSLAEKTAASRARAVIAQSVEATMSTMMKDFMQESGSGENAQALEFTSNVIKDVANQSLSGSVIKETFTAKDGTKYVLIEFPLSNVKSAALGAMKNDEALYNEFKASQAFEALDSELNDN